MNGPQRFRFVAFAVTHKDPDLGVVFRFKPPVFQITHEPGLINAHDRTKPHGNRWKLPEAGHQPGMWIRRKPAAGGQLTSEIFKVFLGQPTFNERPGVNTRRGVALEKDKIAAEILSAGSEEMVKTDLGKGRRRSVSGDVTADASLGLVAADDHGHGVPADQTFDPALDIAVAGKGGLFLHRDRVDIRGIGDKGQGDPGLLGPYLQLLENLAGLLG